MHTQDQTTLGWRIFHSVLFLYLGRSAKKVLLNRALVDKDGNEFRWLNGDLKRFLAATKKEVAKLRPIAELEKLPNTGNRIMVELSILTIAAFRVMCHEGIDPVDAAAAIADTGWNIYASQLSLASLPFRLTSRNPATRLKRTIRLLMWFPFSVSKAPGYEAKSWVKNGDIYTYFTHCPPQTFVRTLIAQQGDKGELLAFTQSWCKYDWPGADIIAGDRQRGHYERAKTLSNGDKVCDMCWKGRANGTAFRT